MNDRRDKRKAEWKSFLRDQWEVDSWPHCLLPRHQETGSVLLNTVVSGQVSRFPPGGVRQIRTISSFIPWTDGYPEMPPVETLVTRYKGSEEFNCPRDFNKFEVVRTNAEHEA